jgi:nitroreductase
MEAILNRRSVRKYTTQAVPEEYITEILEAGMSAPSAGNERPWHFIVVTERSLLDGIIEFHGYAQMLEQAPVAIVVCADPACNKYPGVNYWALDCAAATQNILLAAYNKGLGTCWVSIYPREDRIEAIGRLLDLPKHIVAISVVALGYPLEANRPRRSRYDSQRVHRNGWQSGL